MRSGSRHRLRSCVTYSTSCSRSGGPAGQRVSPPLCARSSPLRVHPAPPWSSHPTARSRARCPAAASRPLSTNSPTRSSRTGDPNCIATGSPTTTHSPSASPAAGSSTSSQSRCPATLFPSCRPSPMTSQRIVRPPSPPSSPIPTQVGSGAGWSSGRTLSKGRWDPRASTTRSPTTPGVFSPRAAPPCSPTAQTASARTSAWRSSSPATPRGRGC